MILQQALHGYGQGHQLLGSSVELLREERWLLDQLSDLCGQLEPGEDFEHFHTSYPCGRFRVFARTWIDRDAPRKGTVFTHSLLLDPAEAANIDDLGRLELLFVKPRKGQDPEPWRRALDLDLAENAAPAAPSGLELRLLAALFVVETRPLLWMEPESAETAARLSWMALPPAQRATWSWCTRALHPRFLDNKPLSWMAPGPNSRSGFANLRAAAIGAALSPGLEAAAKAQGLDSVAVAALARCWPDLPADLPASRRGLVFRLARMRAREDWAALLGALDTDEALDLQGRPGALADVDRALAWLSSRSPAERTLAELAALLARRPWVLAPDRNAALTALVRETLAARPHALSADDERHLTPLARATLGSPLGPAVEAGLRRWPSAR